MRITFLLNEFRPYGGMQRDCVALSRTCADRGHEVSIVTRSWEGKPLDDPAIEVVLLGGAGLSNCTLDRRYMAAAREWLRRHPTDITVGFIKMADLDAYFASDPCYEAKVRRLKPWWYRWTPRYRHFASREHAVFARGRHTIVFLLHPGEVEIYSRLYGTERERLQVLPPGIERVQTTERSRQAARLSVLEEFRFPETSLLVLLVGSGFRTKGVDRAVSAIASLSGDIRREAQLLVAGQDKAAPFGRQAKRLGIGERVHFLGGRPDVGRLMEAGDVLIHPAYSENTGTVLVEALVRGLPVIASGACGFAPHLRRSGGGIVIDEPFDQCALNRALGQLLENRALRNEMGRAGLAYGTSEDLYSCHRRAADLIESIARTRHHSSGAKKP